MRWKTGRPGQGGGGTRQLGHRAAAGRGRSAGAAALCSAVASSLLSDSQMLPDSPFKAQSSHLPPLLTDTARNSSTAQAKTPPCPSRPSGAGPGLGSSPHSGARPGGPHVPSTPIWPPVPCHGGTSHPPQPRARTPCTAPIHYHIPRACTSPAPCLTLAFRRVAELCCFSIFNFL